jgi:hypothetical protein
VLLQDLATAPEPLQMGLRLPARQLVCKAARERSTGPARLLVYQLEVAAVLRLLPRELLEHGGMPVVLRRQAADEDLVAQRRWPAGAAGEPGAQRAFAARGDAEQAAVAGARALVAAGDEAALLQVLEQLVDLADVRLSEGSEPCREPLEQFVAVGLPLEQQCQQCVAQVHAASLPRRQQSERRARQGASIGARVAGRHVKAS